MASFNCPRSRWVIAVIVVIRVSLASAVHDGIDQARRGIATYVYAARIAARRYVQKLDRGTMLPDDVVALRHR